MTENFDFTENFAFTEEYQAKLLSFMLHDQQFCAVARDSLKADQYANKALQWYFSKLANEERFHSAVTLKEELYKAASAKTIKEEEVGKYVSLFKQVCQVPAPCEQEHMRDTIGRFIRTQEVKKAIMDSIDLMESGDNWEEITDRVAKACQAGSTAQNLGQHYFKDTFDRIKRRANEDIGFRIPTGVLELDTYLYGGIKNKQVGLVAGATGRGKSIFLQYMARTAIMHGRKVIYYTLEMPEDDIATRFDSMFAQIEISQVRKFGDELGKSLSELSDKYGDSLIIKEYPADTITVGGIKAHLGQLSAQGWTPDLIIIDYLDLLKPHRSYQSTTEELDAITKAVHGMAKELNTRIWTATQLNRAGIVMENPDETAIAGALSKLFTVDIAIFMAQTKEERQDEAMRLIISKNRNGPAGRSIQIDTDYSYMTFYREVQLSAPSEIS